MVWNVSDFNVKITVLVPFDNTPTQINELDAVYRGSAPSFTTVKFWAAESKPARTSLEDDERSRRPKTATTNDNVAKIH